MSLLSQSVVLSTLYYVSALLIYLFFSSLPLFDFGLDAVLFHPVFFLWVLRSLLGFCVATRSAYDMICSSYVRTLISLFILFLSEVLYTICFSCCVNYLLFFIYFFLLR